MLTTLYLNLYLRGCRSCNRFLSTGSMTGVDRDVLISHRLQGGGLRWLNEVDTGLRPTGLRVCRVHTRAETICRVEHGGLAGAVVIADGRQIEGLSLLRTIRSIDRDLPCWLVTDDTRRATLEAALALRVMSVFTHPVRVEDLTLALTRLLVN